MAGEVPDFNDTVTGPKAGSADAIRDNWTKFYELRLQPAKREFPVPSITDYERRPVEVLTVHVTCKTETLMPGHAEFDQFLTRETYAGISVQSPDENSGITWLPIDEADWRIEKAVVVDQHNGAATLQLTVKTWEEWAVVT